MKAEPVEAPPLEAMKAMKGDGALQAAKLAAEEAQSRLQQKRAAEVKEPEADQRKKKKKGQATSSSSSSSGDSESGNGHWQRLR